MGTRSKSSEFQLLSRNCDTVITGSAFFANDQDFTIPLSANRAMDFSKSFFSYRLTLTRGDGSLLNSEDVSYSMLPISCLYKGVSVYFDSTLVEANSEWIPQLHAIKSRTGLPASLLDGVLDSREYFGHDSYGLRNTEPRNFKSVEKCWKPPLDIFNNSTPISNVTVRISMRTKQEGESFNSMIESKVAIIQSTGDDVDPAKIRFSIDRVRFHIAMSNIDTKNAAPYELVIRGTEIMTKKIRSANDETNSFRFNYNPQAISCCFQDPRVKSDTQFSNSRFRVNAQDTIGPDNLPVGPGVEKRIQTLQVTHAGMSRPNDEMTQVYASGATRYNERYYTSAAVMKRGYYTDVEDFDTWQSRGAIYSWLFSKAGGETDRIVDVKTSFFEEGEEAFPDGINPVLIVASTYHRKIKVTPRLGGRPKIEIINF